MSREIIPGGMYPISSPPPDHLFTHDTKETAEALGIPPAQVMRLAKSGKLLFKFTGDRYRCRSSNIETYRQEMERRNRQGR